MIDPYCRYLDIYPYTWRNLGEVMEYLIPGRSILYVLHNHGHILKAVSSAHTIYQPGITDFHAEDFDDREFFSAHPEIEEIHFLDRTALLHYYQAAQSISLEEKNTVEYLDFITDYYAHHKGIDIYSRKAVSPSFYRKCLDYARRYLDDEQIILFVVTKSKLIWFDVVLFIEHDTITEIRTLDTLKKACWYRTSEPDLDAAAAALFEKFGRNVKIIHYDYSALPQLTKFWEGYQIL